MAKNEKRRVLGAFDDPTVPLPSYFTVKAAIDEIILNEKWDRHKISRGPKQFIKEVNKLWMEHLKTLPHIIAPNITMPDLLFYRMRTHSRHFNEQLISDYSFPPNHVVRSYQRCNIPYHPVFYCSNEPLTAITETVFSRASMNPITPCYLSEWRMRPDAAFHLTPFFFGSLPTDNPFYDFSQSNLTKVRNLFSSHSKEQVEGVVAILELLSKLFIFDNTYSISAFIAHNYLYAPHNLRTDIFLYPSIKKRLEGVNVAINPNCVQHKMELGKVYKFFVEDINRDDGTVSARFTRTGINDNGVILWKPFDKQDEDNTRLLRELKAT